MVYTVSTVYCVLTARANILASLQLFATVRYLSTRKTYTVTSYKYVER